MNKIIPFSKDIHFKDKIGEITSIALDDTLKFDGEYSIIGDLIVRGCSKNDEVVKDFSYPLPVSIAVDSKYDTTKSTIGIDDFYYEIINDDILRVKIDLILDDLYYKEEDIPLENRSIDFDVDISKKDDLIDASLELQKDDKEMQIDFQKDNVKKMEASISLEDKDNKKENIKDLFKEMNDEKEYSVYRVYTVLENDTLDSILAKYKVSKEDLELYNDLSNIKPGIKIIIPSVDE